jgi:excisionase family DNA binding protein
MTIHAGDSYDNAAPRTPLLVTIPQAASLLSISRATLYELLAAGTIESIHIGRSRRIPVEALHDFVEARRVENSAWQRTQPRLRVSSSAEQHRKHAERL